MKNQSRAACLALLSVFVLNAQETRGTIFGRVLDPQNSAVAGSAITITNVETNATMRTRTNDTGYYEANLLIAGNYQITAELQGFKKTVRNGINLPISARVEIDILLSVGEIAETISVTGEAPLLDTSSISAGRVMENRSVVDLPTFNNSPLMLVKLVPGIQASANRRYNGVNALGGTAEAHNAGNVGGNDWSIDGVPNMGNGYSAAYLPYSTTIQEFKVESTNFDASIGHTTGMTVSVMTKGGTNALHGALTEQHWQQRWNGTRFFVKQQYYRNIAAAETAGNTALANQLRNSPKQPSGHSNNYAGTIGGPIVIPKLVNGRNKLFFFFSYDGFEDKKTTESTFNHTVPSLAHRSGNFSDLLAIGPRYQLYDPLSVRADPARPGHFVRDPIPGNILGQSRIINPAAATYSKFFPNPNNPPAAANLEPLNNYLGVAEPYNWSYGALANRFDYQHSEKHRFFGRWTWLKYREDRQDWTYETVRGLQTNGVNRNNSGLTANWVYTPTSSTVFDIGGSANHFREGNILTDVALGYKPSDVGLPTYMDQKAGENHALPIMAIGGTGGYDVLGQGVPAWTNFTLFSTKVNMTHIRGRHTLTAGFDMRTHRRSGGNPGEVNGRYTFSNKFTSREEDALTPAATLGHSYAAFLMGMPASASADTNATFVLRNPYAGWFVQDSWRVNSKLTLMFGLRMEDEWGRTERYNRVIGWFDPSAKLPITDAAQAAYARAPIPELAASQFSVLGGSIYPGVNGVGSALQKNELMFLPRIGAAYQISSHTVVRGGYGMYFDTLNAQTVGPDQSGFSRTTTSPITNDFGVTWLSGNPAGGVSPLSDPFPVRSDGTRFDAPVGAAQGLLARTGSGWNFFGETVPRARQQRWRVDVQHQIGSSMVVSVGYAGSFADQIRVGQRLDSLPGQFWNSSSERNNALATNLNQNVTNPFRVTNFAELQASSPVLYQALASRGYFTSATIPKNMLLRPFPQMNNVTAGAATDGKVKTHSMEASFQRRFARGFTFHANYTALYERDKLYYHNEFDALPSWRQTNAGVPQRFAATGIFELPFGKGRAFAQSGVASAILGGWQMAGTFEWQPGALLDWGNLFYTGNLGNINSGTQTLDRWFNTDGFERNATRTPAAFQARVFPTRVDGARGDGLNRIDANIQRDFRLTEKVTFQLRMDALNAANRSQFENPNLDPVSTNFGRVTNNTSSTMRFLLFQARLEILTKESKGFCMSRIFCVLALLAPAAAFAAPIPLDLSGVKPGPIAVVKEGDTALVRWQDASNRKWEAAFNLETTRALIAAIQVDGKAVVQNAVPIYSAQTGKRRGGFDEFFDFPPSHPDGTRSFQGNLRATAARAETLGDRVEITFDGFEMGIFKGSIRYVFYPGSRLIQQAAVASTNEPDTAYFYEAGLRMAVPRDARAGNNMESEITYYDTEGKVRVEHPNASEKMPVQARYRTLAARAQGGSIAVFPAPHKYFMPRDFTTNMGFLWHTAWRGQVYLGVRQLPDDNSRFYPWMNAPPGTAQRMNVFFLLSDGEAKPLLDEVTRYTNRDKFPRLDGYVTVAPHWHYAYTVQAMEKGKDWVPPFKPVLKDMGVDAAVIADFHGDGHPQSMTEVRLQELKAFFEDTRAQSDNSFLIIPSEEANVHYGGHWALSFPKPVYWHMAARGTKSSVAEVPGYGTVYTIGDAKALLNMVRKENGFVYQTHPRTKGSKTFPDDIRFTEHFLDDTYRGAGWKQMPADMSSPRMGERSLKLLDDMSNWGMRKMLLGEVDVFQIDSTHELYAHMNINYVRGSKLPSYDNYGELLRTMEKRDFFVSTGEVLMPEHSIRETQPGKLRATADIRNTLPLQFAEVVWGDGEKTYRTSHSLETTREFGKQNLTFNVDAPNWRWARLAVWDIAGNGAFANPVWNEKPLKVAAVDHWHNREPEPHYTWEGTYQGGFSGLGRMLRGLGAETRTVNEAFSAKSLKGLDLLIVVDPDTPKESASPNLITDAEIDATAEWVRNGGTLVLLNNDPGNSEFPRMNALAKRFGIEFEERKHADANGNAKLTLAAPQGGWFTPGLKFYGVDLAPLRVTAQGAETLLAERETVMMTAVKSGAGRVIALGDPWLYNEYLYTQDNRRIAEELFKKLLR